MTYRPSPEDPLSRLTSGEFSANRFTPEQHALYVELFVGILGDMEARAGFGTLHRMLAERAAYSFVLLKNRDASEAGTGLHWQDYERVNKIMFAAVDRLFNEAKLTDADETAKRQIGRALVGALAQVVDGMPVPDDQKHQAITSMRAHIEEHVLS